MIKEEYKNGCRLKEQVKYNIDYDDCQILNLTCANYIYDLVQESSKYETKLEDVKKMLYMIEKLLGHEVQYDIPEYHGDNKKCYFGVVSDNFVIDENNIKQLDYVLQDSKEFVESFSTDYQKILYCYPNEFGDINSIKDQNQFEIIKYSQYLEGLEYTKYRTGKLTVLDNKEAYVPLLVISKDNSIDNLPANSSSTFKYFVYNSQTKKLNYRYGDNLYAINSTIVTENNQRPSSSNVDKGTMYFDNTLNKPIFWDGSKWIDATGATV